MKRSREAEEEPTVTESSTASADKTAHISSQTTRIRISKIAELDNSAIDDSNLLVTMRCSLPGHKEPLVFKSYAEYEAHYLKSHTNRCTECRKNFPSDRFLELHIEECHDSFAAVLRERGEHTYSCFVEGCDRKCGTPQKRRMHLIDKHLYPKNYFFAVTKEGIDGRNSLLLEGGHYRRRSSTSQAGTQSTARRLSTKQPEATGAAFEPQEIMSDSVLGETPRTETKEQAVNTDTDMTDLTSAMSTLQFVPNSVRFGRGKGRTGFSKK